MIDDPKKTNDQNIDRDQQNIESNDQGSAGGKSTRDYQTPAQDDNLDMDDDTDVEE